MSASARARSISTKKRVLSAPASIVRMPFTNVKTIESGTEYRSVERDIGDLPRDRDALRSLGLVRLNTGPEAELVRRKTCPDRAWSNAIKALPSVTGSNSKYSASLRAESSAADVGNK